MPKVKALKFCVSIVIIISILSTFTITAFADSKKTSTYKPNTWYKLNDRPEGNEEIITTIPSVLEGIRYVGIRSNDLNKIVSIDKKIYMINNDGTVLEYNTLTDTWTSIDKIKDLDKSNGIFRLIALNGKIYIIGANFSDILEYDNVKKECKFIVKLPTERKVGGAVGVDNKIYILSGEEKGDPNTKRTLDVYDLSKGQWSKKKDMFGGSNDLRVIHLNGKIYTLGVGQDFEVYDIEKDQWTQLSPSPSGIYGAGMQAVNGKIYILPYSSEEGNNIVKEYDPESNSWIGKAALTFDISTFATTECDGEIYVIDNNKVAKYTVTKRNISEEDVDERKDDKRLEIQSNVDNEYTVKVNDKILQFPDAKPFMDNEHKVHIPVKVFADAIGATVSWNSKIKEVTLQKNGDKLVFSIGKAEYKLNGTISKADTAAVIKNGKAFIPSEYISDALGANILLDMGTNTISISFVEKNGYTKDGLEIYRFEDKEYVSVMDVGEKYKCFIVNNMDTHIIKVYGDEMVAGWDLEYTKHLIEIGPELYVFKNDFEYFEVDYYEKTIRPILSQPKETIRPAYSENGLDVYLFNGKEYVLPGDILNLHCKEVLKYAFRYDYNKAKEFNFVKIKEPGNIFCDEYDIILSGIPATVVNGRLSIEYEYYKRNILPLFEE